MSIEVKNLTHTYSAGSALQSTAIRDVNLTIEEGEFVAIVGHTGSGKSTLVQHLNGLLKPTSGQVLVDGEDMNGEGVNKRLIRQKVGLVFQYPEPFNPGSLVLGAKGTFFARSLDSELKLTSEIMLSAAKHDGCSVMEILTNCVIFNDGAHKLIADREFRADRTIVLRHGEKMIFGKNKDKGLVLDGMGLRVVTIGENGVTEDQILVHDAHSDNVGIHMMLADMKYPDYPVALGVIRDVKDVTYDDGVRDQVADVKAKSKIQCVDDLLRSGSTWEVK